MPGKVFISCGQAEGSSERETAQKIHDLLKNRFHLDPYLAFRIQTLDDIAIIFRDLRLSDYYLFVDFFRDNCQPSFSLFTHQELAVAFDFGFGKNIVALCHSELEKNRQGLLRYLLAQPETFSDDVELLSKIESLVKERGWSADYSRHLIPTLADPPSTWCLYADRGKQFKERIWRVRIENRRNEDAAFQTVCILDSAKNENNEAIPSEDRACLKWSGHDAYQVTVMPRDFGLVDVFAEREKPRGIFLHSNRDVWPRRPVIDAAGKQHFKFKVYSVNFPLLEFCVIFDWNEFVENARLVANCTDHKSLG